MHPREICCCFSGHRPSRLPWGSREEDPRCLALKYALSGALEDLYNRGFRHFICGMALGCDFYFAEAVLALRELHPEVTLEAAIPCAAQAEKWSPAQRARYETLLARCDERRLLQREYSPGCMQRRNQYMVDHSALLLSAFAGVPGGTMNTLLYARRRGVETIIIEL